MHSHFPVKISSPVFIWRYFSMSKEFFASNPLVGASIGIGIEPLKNFIDLNLGNVVLTSLPDDKNEAAEVLRMCRENKIYIMLSELVHRHNHERWHSPSLDKETLEKELLPLAGEYFLGRYAIGEAGGILYWPKFYTIDEGVHAYRNMPPADNDAQAHDNYINYLKKELDFERNEVCNCKLYNVESSIVFASHTEAGIDGQCLELLPGDPLITLSAIRGAARAANQNWGVHIAQMYYGGIHCDRMYMNRWRASLYLSYMAGSEFIYPECGHYKYSISMEKSYGFNDEPIRQFRDELRQLYQLSLIHKRPAGFPESPAAIVRGKDDGHPGIWNPYAWGVYESGEQWESSDAERAWELYDTFYKRDALFTAANTGKSDFSGNPPAGQLDIVPDDGDFSAYKLLVFLGTNRMDEKLYAKLLKFVSDGGQLIIAVSHFDNAPERGQKKLQLFRDGKINELCGFDVAGEGESDVYGISVIRQCSDERYDLPVKNYGRDPNFNGRITPVKITNIRENTTILTGLRSSAREKTTIEEISQRPLLVEHRLGKGLVLTLTSAEAPGSSGLREFANCLIYAAIRAHRSDLDIIAGDRIRYAVYPDGENTRFYCYNSDPDVTGGMQVIYQEKRCGEVLLAPGAFRSGMISEGLIFMPANPLWEGEKSADGNYTFATTQQPFTIFNTTDCRREIKLNGQTVTIEQGGRAEVICPEYIPADKAAVFSADFLVEKAVDINDLTTPY